MTEEIICYHHGDMDGIGSASIVLRYYFKNVKFISVNYGSYDIKKEDIKDKLIVLVDFTFDIDTMNLIKENAKEFIWIDHHISVKKQYPELWSDNNIKGIRSIEKAGCELTWDYFYDEETTPEVIKLIGDRDIFTFKYGERTKIVHEYLSLYYTEPTLSLFSVSSEQVLEESQILLDKKNSDIKWLFKNGFDADWLGYKTRVINTPIHISDLGNYCYEEKGYDIAFIYSIIEDGIRVSLRSKTIDVGELASMFEGGGGHKFASGFTIKNDSSEFFKKMIIGKNEEKKITFQSTPKHTKHN